MREQIRDLKILPSFSGGLAFWAWQSPNESKDKQNVMKCPDLSIPITFHSGIGIVVNATCAEYFEPVDPCSGISCQDRVRTDSTVIFGFYMSTAKMNRH